MESRSLRGLQGLELQDSHGAPGCSTVSDLGTPVCHPQLLPHLVGFIVNIRAKSNFFFGQCCGTKKMKSNENETNI